MPQKRVSTNWPAFAVYLAENYRITLSIQDIKTYEILKQHFGNEHAEIVIGYLGVVGNWGHKDIATKNDLQEFKGVLRQELVEVKGELRLEIEKVRADVQRTKNETTIWIIGFIIAWSGVMLAFAKLLFS